MLFKEIKKYIYIICVFFKYALISNMEYRFNFFAGFFLDAICILIRMLFVMVVYETHITIRGLFPDYILLHVGVFTIISGLFGLFFSGNFCRISEYIEQGTLDSFITKPISSQFMVTFRNINIGMAIPDLLCGGVLTSIAFTRLNISVDIFTLIGLGGFIISSLAVMYSILLLPQLINFWIIRGSNISTITDAAIEFNVMPMNIYNIIIQQIGIFVMPLFVIPNYPTLFLFNRLGIAGYVWGILAPIIWVGIVRFFWKVGMKNYSSASS